MERNTETILLTDGYKLDHRRQYPKGTQYVYCNFVPRSCNWYPEAKEGVVVFGIQYFIREYLIKQFNQHFFGLPKEQAISRFDRRVSTFLGQEAFDVIGSKHIEDLYDLGYLPISIKALPEGTLCPFGVPVLTITNTLPEFFWLPNYLETLLSTTLWLPMTSATTARIAKKALIEHAKKTGFPEGFDIGFNCHDFSMRGMAGVEAAVMSGMGHMTSWNGSETLPAIAALEEYYDANAEKELIAATVPATEHSVMCAGGKDTEFDTFKRLLTEVYPKGFVSIVSDTWDFWQVITDYIPRLKETIMAREGRFVVRPDSGDPVDIICGPDPRDIVELNGKKYYVWGLVSKGDAMYQEINYKKLKHDPEFAEKHLISEAQIKGAYECLWDIFGGTTTDKGYKVLDTHIGLIYGDSITLEKQKQIYERLEAKGFAATNIVLGFGSYTYQLKSRDSLGFAMKATWCQINDIPHEIFKSPKTDSGVKKSLKGLCQVLNIEGKYHVKDQCTPEEEVESCLQPVFMDGVELKSTTLKEIRNNVDKSIQASLC